MLSRFLSFFWPWRNPLSSSFVQAYSLHDREVGYCQGSPFIVGMLLMAVSFH